MDASRLLKCLHGWSPLPFRHSTGSRLRLGGAGFVTWAQPLCMAMGPHTRLALRRGAALTVQDRRTGWNPLPSGIGDGAVICPDVHHGGAFLFLQHRGMGGREPHGQGCLPVMLDTLAGESISRWGFTPCSQGRPLGQRSPPVSHSCLFLYLCFSQLHRLQDTAKLIDIHSRHWKWGRRHQCDTRQLVVLSQQGRDERHSALVHHFGPASGV